MKLIITIYLMLLSTLSLGQECRNYTPEQTIALHTAYAVGAPYDLGYTLAAITKQEGFVGKHIIRVNSKDGKYGSYGITHINLETGMWLNDEDNSWKARAKMAPKLMTDDVYALKTALRKLETVHHLGWRDMVRSYNGSVRSDKTLTYLNSIIGHINQFKKCGVFE